MSYLSEMRTALESWIGIGVIYLAILYLLYSITLLRPLPDIPYNTAAVRSLLGDLLAILSYLGKGHNTLITYFNDTVISLNSPLVQVFLKPLGTPTLLLSDYNKARAMLMRSSDFDRSPALKDSVSGLVPDHHIHLKTDAVWRAQRDQIRDLMKPSFLKDVAGPMIYRSLSVLMDAWAVKCRIANGRPWSVGADARNAALNAIMGFAFRPDGEHNANRSMREVLNMRQDADDGKMNWQTESPDEPIDFPSEQMSYMLQALIDLTETVMEIHGSPLPELQMGIRQPHIANK